ncbi:tetratricopeptide repeat protein [bacterium]|nr:tetratricopeptide repeat protein [bacterium]
MRRATPLLITGLATLLLLVSCSEELPQSELDRFISQIEAMPREAAIDTLHQLAGQAGQDQAFAQYQLGNIHYSAAVDSARMRGWNDEYAKAFLDSAQHWFEAAVATDSTFVEAYVNLGALWDDRADMMAVRRQREERIATAREMYERALALRPHDEKARCNLGSLYKRRNDFERAMQEYMTVLEHDPRSALAHYNLAILFATQKIYREAITEFELAVKYDPEGDIGERSRENIEIIRDLLESQEAEARKPS